MERRGFLGLIIGACVAPAVLRPGIIMPIKPKLVVAPKPLVIERGGLVLMERVIDRGELEYDPFFQGREYRWVRQSLLGEPDVANIIAHAARGWEPVSAERELLLREGGILKVRL